MKTNLIIKLILNLFSSSGLTAASTKSERDLRPQDDLSGNLPGGHMLTSFFHLKALKGTHAYFYNPGLTIHT